MLDVAAHLRDAGDQAPAVARRQWCAAAGERAVELGAWSDAVAAFTAALEDGGADDLEPSRLLALHVSAATASGADTTWTPASGSRSAGHRAAG